MSKNSTAQHYQRNKRKLQKKSCESYQDFSEEEKNKKISLSKKKKRLVECRKKYKISKNKTVSQGKTS